MQNSNFQMSKTTRSYRVKVITKPMTKTPSATSDPQNLTSARYTSPSQLAPTDLKARSAWVIATRAVQTTKWIAWDPACFTKRGRDQRSLIGICHLNQRMEVAAKENNAKSFEIRVRFLPNLSHMISSHLNWRIDYNVTILLYFLT